MSSTNKTTNYELSQFIGSDKPAWLVDYNQDMTKIDTRMKANADLATGADGKADANTTKIGDLDYLSTTVKTSLVGAINEVDGKAETAQGTANSASQTANGADEKVDSLASYLNMTNYGKVADANITISAGSISQKNVNYMSNNSGTLGKLYGWLFGINITGATTITIGNLPFDVDEEFNVNGIMFAQDTSSKTLYYPTITFHTNNTATISFGASYSGVRLNIYFGASLIFIKNFGDVA